MIKFLTPNSLKKKNNMTSNSKDNLRVSILKIIKIIIFIMYEMNFKELYYCTGIC